MSTTTKSQTNTEETSNTLLGDNPIDISDVIISISKLREVLEKSSGVFVFDIETDGLLKECTTIHCLSFKDVETGERHTIAGIRGLIKQFFRSSELLIGHNIICYDLVAVNKIYGIEYKGEIIDTIGLSYYLHCQRHKPGLESWGEELGINKVEIDDWTGLSLQEYAERCEVDVEINYKLFILLLSQLKEVYSKGGDLKKCLKYLNFKLQCIRDQEANPLKVDRDKIKSLIIDINILIDEKVIKLKEVMPKNVKMRDKSKPKVMYKIDGNLSIHGEAWLELLKENNLPPNHEEDVKIIQLIQEPNPNSDVQIKDWLFSLGWKPCTFTYKRNKETNDIKKIPKVREDGELTESVLKLVNKEPAIEELEDLGILSHRSGFLKGLLENSDEEGFIIAGCHGFTNTLRLKHSGVVNVPGKGKKYGEEVRSCFIAEEGKVLCGSDVSSLEDSTKQHYIYPYDQKYVEELQKEGYDPHLEIAKVAGYLTEEQVENHKKGIEDYSEDRYKGKQVNFSAIYGVGVSSLARNAGITQREAKTLLEAYWKKNWAVKKLAEDVLTKEAVGQKWLYNPVSDMWYSLRYEKDIFSTLNQGTGVFCFDTWVAYMRSYGLIPSAQFHDEVVIYGKKGDEDKIKNILDKSMTRVNNKLSLNVKLSVDTKFGNNYYEVH